MRGVRPAARVRLLTVVLAGLGLTGILLWAPVEDGWRRGLLLGVGLGTCASVGVFELRLATIVSGGKGYLHALIAGFALNLVFLCGGTILALYSAWLGHYLGFAFGYMGAVLLLKGLFTWALHRELGERNRR